MANTVTEQMNAINMGLTKEPTPNFVMALLTIFHDFGTLDGMANHNRQMIILTTLQGLFL